METRQDLTDLCYKVKSVHKCIACQNLIRDLKRGTHIRWLRLSHHIEAGTHHFLPVSVTYQRLISKMSQWCLFFLSFLQYSTFQCCYEFPVIYHTIITYPKSVKMTSKRQFHHEQYQLNYKLRNSESVNVNERYVNSTLNKYFKQKSSFQLFLANL